MHTSGTPLIKQGWLRALLFIIVFIGCSFSFEILSFFLVTKVFAFELAAPGGNAATLTRYAVALAGSAALIWAWRRFIDRKDFLSIGFDFKPFADDAWTGFFTAVLLLGVGTILLAIPGYLSFGDPTFEGKSFLINLALMLMIAFSEELVVRGYVLNNLLQSVNTWVALGISAVFFALMHLGNPDMSIISFAIILVAGFFIGINYIYTRNLWFGIFFHFAWNFIEGPVYGYEVSGITMTSILDQTMNGPDIITGGPFGFEGSIICLLLLVAATILLNNFFSKKYVAEK
jgi:membrane protease YdiL (CAAX protease family)